MLKIPAPLAPLHAFQYTQQRARADLPNKSRVNAMVNRCLMLNNCFWLRQRAATKYKKWLLSSCKTHSCTRSLHTQETNQHTHPPNQSAFFWYFFDQAFFCLFADIGRWTRFNRKSVLRPSWRPRWGVSGRSRRVISARSCSSTSRSWFRKYR